MSELSASAAPQNESNPLPSVTASIESEQREYVAQVQRTLETFLNSKRSLLEVISPDTLDLLESISALVSGGKRLRALLCYWGYRGAGGSAMAPEIVTAGAALELFQAAALIHDDIIDRSDTRRGAPSVHKRFEIIHANNNWSLDREHFAQAAAILTGDLCLSLSEELFSSIPQLPPVARNGFNVMRAEVMAGQYLDILEEVSGPGKDPATAVSRAAAIVRFKSAKYSSEHPLGLGGALANADKALLESYSAFALPLGEAFQLRDDVLGVFGDPATTGKPAGDDLREGKRTVLIGFALEPGAHPEAEFLDANLGKDNLSDVAIDEMIRILVDSKALARTEEMIESLSSAAFRALSQLPIDDSSRTALQALGERAVKRLS